jgi:predicted RNA-binding Zn-ribbon protein involved in translation (DUF1610 family)
MGSAPIHTEAPQQKSILDFVSPTEFVELPSKGLAYSEEHPLHGQDVIEIRYMTAKDEDILTSETLLRKGLALERLLENIIINKTIDPKTMLIGDRNAVIIAARASGYGNTYETKTTCPNCGTGASMVFDLSTPKIQELNFESLEFITKNETGNFVIKLPQTDFSVEVRLLTGKDEQYLTQLAQNKKKNKLGDSAMTDQYKMMIVSVEGVTDKSTLAKFIEVMPASDSRFLRKAYKSIIPNIKITDDFSCTSCGHEQELEVSFGADFFWPDS